MIVLFHNVVLYRVEFCLFITRTCLSLVRQILPKFLLFDVYVSYLYLLFVVYSVMAVCLYAVLNRASCTCV